MNLKVILVFVIFLFMGAKIMICQGGSCRKRKKALRALASVLGSFWTPVRCQKICKGPVVGCEVNGELKWFADLQSRKSQEGLLRLVGEGKVTKPLKKRRVKKRDGKLR
jgi:hypothetical protein